MKAKRITYSRLVSKGNYENAKIEIEMELEEGDKAADVFTAAKKFVDNRVKLETESQYEVKRAEAILRDRRNYTIGQVEEAEEVLKNKEVEEDLPF